MFSISLQLADKRLPDSPASQLPPSTPSAPRAMASDGTRSGKSDAGPNRDRDWKAAPHPPTGPGSLRSRIGEKSAPYQSDAPPPTAFNKDEDRDGSHRKRTASGELPTHLSHDSLLTESLTERDTETKEAPTVAEPEPGTQPSKRPKINRNRYGTTTVNGGSSAFAKRTLPLADKPRPERND